MKRSDNASAHLSRKGALMVAGAACLWGTFSLFLRPAERLVEEAGGRLSAATESFILLGIVFVVLSPSNLLRKPLAPPPKSALFWLILFSIADALNVLLYFGAMQRTSVAVAVLTHYLQPVIVAVLSPWVMKEARQKGTGWVALGAVVGLALLVDPVNPLSATDSGRQQPVLGATMGTLSAFLFATVVFSVKKLSAWFSSNQIQCLHFPGALLILFAFIPPGEFSMGLRPAGLLLLAGLIPGTLGGYLFIEGVRHLRPSTAGILTLLEPIVALLVGILFWNEQPSAISFIGVFVILFSAYQVLKQPD